MPTMIQLRARKHEYRMALTIHCGGDSEILYYEYNRNCGNTSDGEFTSGSADDDGQEIEQSIEELFQLLNETEKKKESRDE